ncbi:hypothetical protein DL770_010921 [Monosporascus sp. CRB-9-2]|nr:hypothetical protein DL770_010921 [Monosporascus sp. CRB-9-2]
MGADRELILRLQRLHRRLVAKTKRRYWEERITGATSDKAIYQITGWQKLTDRFRSPPLKNGNILVTDIRERIDLLRSKVLIPKADGEDIDDPWWPLPQLDVAASASNLARDWHVTMAEAETCCIGSRNTAPGTDGVTVRILQTAWPAIGPSVRMLYEGCLRFGHHPTAFRSSEIVMLQKVGKTDFTAVKPCKPISLLSCLGKGLKRLIARYMAVKAIKAHILNPQQFGALPKRSATDLAAYVAHDIEQAFLKGKEASLLTLDISGAFNAVLKNRLVLRPRQQHWPHKIVRWVDSFMTGRTAAVRMENVQTDPAKCELMHFNRKGEGRAAQVSTDTGFTVAPLHDKMRWLEVIFDPKLNFKPHVEHWGGKALKVANHMRSLNRTIKGSPPAATSKAAAAFVLSVATYAAEAWWPGRFRGAVKHGGISSSRVQGQLTILDKAIRATPGGGPPTAAGNRRTQADQTPVETYDKVIRDGRYDSPLSPSTSPTSPMADWPPTGLVRQGKRQHGMLPEAEGFDAEAEAARQAARWAEEALLATCESLDALRPRPCTVQWLPSHVDIPGNEAADTEAKLGALAEATLEDEDGTRPPPTLTWLRRLNRRKRREVAE